MECRDIRISGCGVRLVGAKQSSATDWNVLCHLSSGNACLWNFYFFQIKIKDKLFSL